MANKFIPKTSKPPAPKMPTTGAHNPNVGAHGSGIAPRNASAGQKTDKLSMPAQAGLARVANVGKGNPQGRLPVQSPPANVVGSKIGQPNPQTGAAATAKPKRKGIGAAFYGEY